MQPLSEHIQTLSNTFIEDLALAFSDEQAEELRVRYLGRNGTVTQLLATLKDLSLDDKKLYGPQLNKLRDDIHQSIILHKERLVLRKAELLKQQQAHFDVTAYKPVNQKGSLHPFTSVIQSIEDIFMSMGYSVVQGPEIETEGNNFEGLNIPKDHPARDMQDTFWLTLPELLLRTHTSTVQIRTMKNSTPPLAIIAPGRVFRHEATDASHDFTFMQLEGLVINTDISLSNLFATIKAFMQALFENSSLDIRVRPSYFPFVEPGAEVDITCPFCKGGCSVCKKTGWIELGGAGLVHPHVLRYCGIDPLKYSGFAFGFGIERFAMLKYKIYDIRLFRSGKIDFLKQF